MLNPLELFVAGLSVRVYVLVRTHVIHSCRSSVVLCHSVEHLKRKQCLTPDERRTRTYTLTEADVHANGKPLDKGDKVIRYECDCSMYNILYVKVNRIDLFVLCVVVHSAVAVAMADEGAVG